MRLSNKNLTKNVEDRIREVFYQTVADVRTYQDAKTLIADLLSETEQLAIAKRLAVALFLKQGKSYEEIKREFKVSSATVAKIQESLDSPGIKLALSKVQTDEWAGQWADKISSAFNKLIGK